MDHNKIDELCSALKHRATVRNFDTSQPLEPEILDKLLEAAAQAPTTGNMQLYSVIVTTDPQRLKRMRELHAGQPVAENCSALLTFCADTRRFATWCTRRRTRSGLNNFSGWLMAVVDATIYAQQFVALAEQAGLGTCYLGSVTYDLPAFCYELGCPMGVTPLFSIAVGVPAGNMPAPSDRLPLEAFVHREKYHDPDAADIDRFYAAKEALPDSAKFIEENGKQTLAQVYAEVRYPGPLNQRISADLLDHLDLRQA